MWSQALEDLLRDNGVEYRTRDVHGAWLTARTGVQRQRFFVPYRDYQKASELNDAFFSADFEFETE